MSIVPEALTSTGTYDIISPKKTVFKEEKKMVPEITEKTILRQLAGSAAGAITATVITDVILGGCAVFCGTQLGWKELLSKIFLAATALCTLLLIYFIIKGATGRRHPAFKRYGSPAMLAARINDGLKAPLYLAMPIIGNAPFATLITKDFIVSGVELVSFMELKEFRYVHAAGIQTRQTIVVGNPLLTAGSLAANRMADNYYASKGLNSQTQFDMLIFDDANGKQHQYGVQHQDMERVLNAILQVAPHIQFVPY